jgi:acyl-CoA dehydrogenase
MSATCFRECSVAKTELYEDLRQGIRQACVGFPDSYWRELDVNREYPEEFVKAMTEAGYLGALIPEEYGGLGLSLLRPRSSSKR